MRLLSTLAVAAGGGALVLAGLALLVLPGPGWPLIFGGLSILARRFAWAARLLAWAKARARNLKDRALRREKATA